MLQQTFKIVDEDGFHAGPINELVYVANKYLDCALFAVHQERRVTLHSILGVLSLNLNVNDELMITAEGDQELAAMRALKEVIIRTKIGCALKS
ncbi:HPr family phosphocarrier protein [Paenibacillus illinoisensis]|uniref:HPr family phosphocarrier protein n=1 Tax=Paenibacillus illinoisensis TaxID=59845 RepID=UPI00301B34C5